MLGLGLRLLLRPWLIARLLLRRCIAGLWRRITWLRRRLSRRRGVAGPCRRRRRSILRLSRRWRRRFVGGLGRRRRSRVGRSRLGIGLLGRGGAGGWRGVHNMDGRGVVRLVDEDGQLVVRQRDILHGGRRLVTVAVAAVRVGRLKPT